MLLSKSDQMIYNSNYMVKIFNPARANQIFWKRVYYPKLRRSWIRGSKLVFTTKRISEDVFIGLGKIKANYDLSVLDHNERKICIQNNFHSKIIFDTVIRFLPAVVTRDAKFISPDIMEGPSLDGAYLSDSEVSSIEGLAKIMIMS
jgi:hypothetical protein